VALTLPPATTPDPVPLVPVGVLASGALQLPERPTVLGWYAGGAVPGDPAGTAVVAGHVDSARYGAGPLEGLLSLRAGDVVAVTDAAGGLHRYAVASRTSIAKPALPPELFRTDGPPQLALVTCGGAFDERSGSYADNVVVVAVPVP
jgi:sortase (surface protein transpeptidase)